MQSPNGQPTGFPVPNEPVTISYADDGEGTIYWRCESAECPSRITEPGREPAAFVGRIVYTDHDDGFRLLGTVAVAHATMLDAAPLGTMVAVDIEEANAA